MIAYLFYNRESAGEWRLSRYADELDRDGGNYELVDADSARGISLASMYGLYARPAIVLARDDGATIDSWTEPELFPSARELAERSRQ